MKNTKFMPLLGIVRGLPGSGKSTFAQSIVKAFVHSAHFEADMYHMDHLGNYNFVPENVRRAHEWCFDTTRIYLNHGYFVMVSNTFTRVSEFQKYLDYGNSINALVNVYRCTGDYGNIHNVPQNVLDNMRERFEDYPGEVLV